jgi:hypothetical protein
MSAIWGNSESICSLSFTARDPKLLFHLLGAFAVLGRIRSFGEAWGRNALGTDGIRQQVLGCVLAFLVD